MRQLTAAIFGMSCLMWAVAAILRAAAHQEATLCLAMALLFYISARVTLADRDGK